MRLLGKEEGQATALLAMLMGTCLLGFFALALDVGQLYRERRLVQSAADAGALAAAAGESASLDINAAARAAVAQNGLTVGTGPGQVTVTASTVTGSSTLGFVQVVATAHTPTYFMGWFGRRFNPMDVSASAQASYRVSSNACMTALSQTGAVVPNASGVETNGSTNMTWGTTVMADIATEGSGSINTPKCGIEACGPASEVSGSGKTAASLYAWGSGKIQGLETDAPSYGTDNSGSSIKATPILKSCAGDPLAGQMPTPPTAGTCIDPTWMSQHTAGGAAETISPGTYCNFNTSNVSTLTMQPGTYVITKTFSTNSGTTITGNGVTIYLANGAIANSGNYTYVSGGATPYGVGNGTTMNITAPTGGTYSGIAIWDGNASSASPDTFTFGGGASSTFSGSIYAPNTNLVLGNGSGTSTISSEIVANTVMILGGSTLQNNYNPSAGAAAGGVNLAE